MTYLILSLKWTKDLLVWWRPKANGYTTDLGQAGIYTEEVQANIGTGDDRDIAVPSSEAFALPTRQVIDSEHRHKLRMRFGAKQ